MILEKMKMKKLSYIKLYRSELARISGCLTARELSLFLILVSNSGWDPRHKEHYSKIHKTQREIKSEFLPEWPLGKINAVLVALQRKGFIEKIKRGFLINYVWIYTASQKTITGIFSNPEHVVQIPKQIFQESEHFVRTGEQLNLRKEINKLVESKRLPRGP